MPELTISGFDELVQGMTVKVPSLLRKMAFNVDANIASAGRLLEQRQAHTLRMGQPQRKGFWSFAKVRSKWDPDVGWVSTSRAAAKGGTGFRMSSFGWERAKKGSVTAPYSNQLANLWHRPSREYRSTSPLVGTPGHYTRWHKGERRPARYNWSRTYGILASMQAPAIAKTEAQFAPQIEEIGQ